MSDPDANLDEPTVHETVERHVEHVERAADKGLLNRRQAERLIGAGQKANRSMDLARGIRQRDDDGA